MAVEKRALILGLKYLRSWYAKMRLDAIKKNKGQHRFRSRSNRMEATHQYLGTGGILPFFRDEIVPTFPQTVDELIPYVETTGSEPDLMVKKWREEAEQQVKYPAILNQQPEELPTLDQFMTSEDIPTVLKRKEKRKLINASDLNFD